MVTAVARYVRRTSLPHNTRTSIARPQHAYVLIQHRASTRLIRGRRRLASSRLKLRARLAMPRARSASSRSVVTAAAFKLGARPSLQRTGAGVTQHLARSFRLVAQDTDMLIKQGARS